MPYVTIHRDITKVKTKLALNLTKRQLICFGIAIAVGIPTYFLSQMALDTSSAVLVMMVIMLPFFFLAMYERDGKPLEKVLKYILIASVVRPKTRPYKSVNLYVYLDGRGDLNGNRSKTGKAANIRQNRTG